MKLDVLIIFSMNCNHFEFVLSNCKSQEKVVSTFMCLQPIYKDVWILLVLIISIVTFQVLPFRPSDIPKNVSTYNKMAILVTGDK
jgi:hypothetical protein